MAAGFSQRAHDPTWGRERERKKRIYVFKTFWGHVYDCKNEKKRLEVYLPK